MRGKMLFLAILFLGLAVWSRPLPAEPAAAELWTDFAAVLRATTQEIKYRAADGEFTHTAVDYKKMKASKEIGERLRTQAQRLRKAVPPRDRKGKLAFWINAYNFFTLVEVRDHYPVESMKAIGWKKEHHVVGGKTYSLDAIEHKLLRPLKDPRIHFAVNCASVGCPSLSRAVYNAAKLDAQLTAAARNGLKNPLHVYATAAGEVHVTQLFLWFGRDFKVKPYGNVPGFIRAYGPARYARQKPVKPDINYDWSLNTAENIRRRLAAIAKARPKLKLREVK